MAGSVRGGLPSGAWGTLSSTYSLDEALGSV